MDDPGHPQQNSLILRRELPVRRELLWDYVSTAGGLSCWQADQVEGDLATGGFSLRWPELGARLDLSVQHLERGHRLLLGAGMTGVDLRVGEGFIELVHQGLDAEDDLLGFESSWNAALALLEVACTCHPHQERRVTWLFQRVGVHADLLDTYFTDVQALGSWLGRTKQPLVSGEAYELELFGGLSISGKVLHAARDVSLQVEQWRDGVLSLRSLPGPNDGRVVAISISTWSFDVSQQLYATFQGALSRLARAAEARAD